MRIGRVARTLPVFVATVIALIALAGAGTAAAGAQDLSSAAGADTYLESLGVNPASVAHQTGRLNYAGPKCPGKGWNCTTDTRVVQIAAAGGQNRVECTGESFTEQEQACVVLQTGEDNSARCIERSTSPAQAQSCTIVQSGARNDALIDQSVDQNADSTQTVTQEASLTQTGAESFNRGSIRQSAKQNTHQGPEQMQLADQAVLVNQIATAGAENKLHADQVQDQNAEGGTLQHQNWELPILPDCYPSSPAASPHICANISQSSQAGDNDSHLRQVVTENAKSNDFAVQLQGNFAGGLDARVHQDTVTGRQRNDANQDKRQHAHAADGSTQTQVDPIYCCGAGSQVGGSDNRESIDQASSQDASNADAFQESTLIGQSLTPDGTCDVKQHARDNADATTNSASLTPCPFLILATQCTSGGEEETPGCTAFPPVTTPPDSCQIECVQGPLALILRGTE